MKDPTCSTDLDWRFMTRALELAARGQGDVEPNPMVGCVIAQQDRVVGEGWHRRFGGAHAEVEAMREAGDFTAGATMYVTLEPCCHQAKKTPPCTDAVIASQVRRVVIAQQDPFPRVDGGGIRRLRQTGIDVDVGLLEHEARSLNAPYLKLINTGRPWVIAKWAMTLDGKIASRSGDSRWISSEASREVAHRLRGRVDAIVIGRRTAEVDDPLLTARPPGPRVAMRVVLDSKAVLDSASQLVRSAQAVPLLVYAAPGVDPSNIQRLTRAGCEVIVGDLSSPAERLNRLLDELGRRRMTNVLVEGGSTALGAFLDAGAIDEVHAFIAPRLVGGATAPGPLGGQGLERIASALSLQAPTMEQLGGDFYVHGRVDRR